MINIGTLAKRYGMLPSQVAIHATSFDLMIDDVMTTWEKYQQKPDDPANFKEDDLQALLKSVK
jgi:hypothetical protein